MNLKLNEKNTGWYGIIVFVVLFCYNLVIRFHELILVGGARVRTLQLPKHSLSTNNNNNNNKSNPVFEAFFNS